MYVNPKIFYVDWGGYVSEASMPFILIVGSFRPEQVTEILDGFLNTVRKKMIILLQMSDTFEKRKIQNHI